MTGHIENGIFPKKSRGQKDGIRQNVREVERRLRSYRTFQTAPAISEQQLMKAVAASRQAFYEGEYSGILTRAEFLFWQVSYIRKRWWLMQLLVLAALWGILYVSDSRFYMQRSMGVLAPVFVTLLIPELWKNRSSGSMEVEGASCFNLQQIYAARIFAFGLVDVFLLSIFCGAAVLTCHLPAEEMLVHFFLPLTVAAGICYRTLCSRWCFSGGLAVTLCLVWSAAWTILVLDGNLYNKLSQPIWTGILAIAVFYLLYALCRVLIAAKGGSKWN